MASFARLACRSGRVIFKASQRQFIQRNLKPASCCISTSKKNTDSATITDKLHPTTQVEENLEEKDENWISYGYNVVDRQDDEWAHHLTMLCCVTITLVGGAFFMAYMPDYKYRAWRQREAYLELSRREREGLPLVDGNLVDPAKVNLPSDEELGDFDIVI